MEKVEKYIQEHTNRYSNHVELAPYITGFTEWLTIDDARRVTEIAREETIKEVYELIKNNIGEYVLPNKGLDLDWFIEDLKKCLEDKL